MEEIINAKKEDVKNNLLNLEQVIKEIKEKTPFSEDFNKGRYEDFVSSLIGRVENSERSKPEIQDVVTKLETAMREVVLADSYDKLIKGVRDAGFAFLKLIECRKRYLGHEVADLEYFESYSKEFVNEMRSVVGKLKEEDHHQEELLEADLAIHNGNRQPNSLEPGNSRFDVPEVDNNDAVVS